MVNAVRGPVKQRRRRMLEIGDRDGWLCWICKAPVDQELPTGHLMKASLDHVIPRWKGGSDSSDNLRISHHICNTKRDAALRRQEDA